MESVTRIKSLVWLFSILCFTSCKSKMDTIKTFEKNRSDILAASTFYVANMEPDDEIVVSLYGKEVSMSCMIEKGQTVTFYFDKKDFSFLRQTARQELVDRNPDKFKQLYDLVTSKESKAHMENLSRTKAKGWKIRYNWFFITFGASGVQSNHPDISSGIVITSNSEVAKSANFVEKIDDGIYLFDLVLF